MIFKALKNFIFKNQGPKRYSQLFDEIRRVKPSNILEIGTWTGTRSKQMIDTAKRNTSNKIAYYGFDLFEEFSNEAFTAEFSKRPPREDDVRKTLEKTGVQISLFKGDTKKTLRDAAQTLPQMDFIFIDGGHSLETIESDWECASKLLSKDGVLIFDDYWKNRTDAGAKKIVDSIDKNLFRVEIMPIVDIVENSEFGHLSIQFAKVSKK